ncbi:MAG: phosphatase PAP2 family protein [Chitinophagaceae bacterium]|nr:MAG: phosphatase PAP2 family protein [Chitinophagaceae bacterium]
MRVLVVLLALLLGSLTSGAQETDTLIRKLDSLSRKTDSADKQINNTAPAAYNEETQLTFKTYFVLLGSDIKQAYTKPFHMKGRDWGSVGKFVLVAGAVVLADKPLQRTALRWRNQSQTLRNVSSYVTEFGGDYEGIVIGSLGKYGLLSKNRKMQTTTLLATQSYITAVLVSGTVKILTGRERPYLVNPASLEANGRFRGPFETERGENGRVANRSFPSGHTTAAFAAATVYALEYRNKPWVPILAYSAASLIGLSRISENKHWATDVLVGAALGYVSGRLVVNNYHRFAQLKAPATKGAVTFNCRYHFGRLMPGAVYHFR